MRFRAGLQHGDLVRTGGDRRDSSVEPSEFATLFDEGCRDDRRRQREVDRNEQRRDRG